MSTVLADTPLRPALTLARETARAAALPCAGSVPPIVAGALMQACAAVQVDVRSAEERKFAGQVPDIAHAPWARGTSLTRNPRFVRELEAKVRKDQPVLLPCRSGKRSALASEAATTAGFTNVFTVQEGFEGEPNGARQRGTADGWRFRGLPWVQDR